MAWTDEIVEDLRKMWSEGLTTGEIAKRLNVSKNSIVGKVHRLGLSGRPSPIKKKVLEEDVAPVAVIEKEAKHTKKEKNEALKTVESIVETIKEPAKKEQKTGTKVESKEPKSAKELRSDKEQEREKDKENFHAKKEVIFEIPKDGVVKLVDLNTHTCRWPIGDPKDEKFHFCGKKVKIGQTYCDEHSEVAYVKQTKR